MKQLPLLLLLLLAACGPGVVVPTPTVVLTAAPRATASATPVPPTQAPTQAPAATIVATATRATPTPSAVANIAFAYSYPIGTPGKSLGDGFFIRHGDQTENTWYNPDYWHTGEDWYARDDDTAGAQVYAIGAGTVVYAGANYPGRVVIVRHASDLFSMYGHLDPQLAVAVDQPVERGDQIGTVLRRADTTPSHLHFEIRTFLTSNAVNGERPRYPFRCGPNCPPGPGYWPIKAPDLPSDLGWRNPTHVIGQRMLPPDAASTVVAATQPISASVTLWSAPPGAGEQQPLGALQLQPGARYQLLEVYAGPADTRATSALAYALWYRIQLADGRAGWVQAAVPSTFDTGADGRPSSVFFNFYPDTRAE